MICGVLQGPILGLFRARKQLFDKVKNVKLI